MSALTTASGAQSGLEMLIAELASVKLHRLRAIDFAAKPQCSIPCDPELGRVPSKRNRRSAFGSKSEEWFDPVRSI